MVLIIPLRLPALFGGCKAALGPEITGWFGYRTPVTYARILWGAIGRFWYTYIHIQVHVFPGAEIPQCSLDVLAHLYVVILLESREGSCFRFWHKMRHKIINIINRHPSYVPYSHAIYMPRALVTLLYITDKTPLFHCVQQENVFNSPVRSCLVHGLI